MLKRLWKALNDNALEIHQLHTGEKTFEDLKEPIPAVMFCQHCGCEVLPDEDTHVCTCLELPN
jgi:Rieske Fe-S protein